MLEDIYVWYLVYMYIVLLFGMFLAFQYGFEFLVNVHTTFWLCRFNVLLWFHENRRDASLANKPHKKRVKAQYYKLVQPRVFNEGDLVLTYDRRHDKSSKGKV